jgi:pyruvate/2-oxoglutarate dehydrogenase complex dihydrolipoamide acyltransferase (E2) component
MSRDRATGSTDADFRTTGRPDKTRVSQPRRAGVKEPKSRLATFDIGAGDAVKVGEVLHLTLLVDHDAVDRAPLARFVQDLNESVESGAGL